MEPRPPYDFRGFSPDFGNVGYDTTAGGGGNQGMPFRPRL
jgi:hypothetical protein